MRPLLPTLLLVTACAGSLESGLRDARESGGAPAELRVLYDDHDPLLGGDRIEITGDGHMRIWRFRPGFVSATDAPEHSLGEVDVERSPAEPPTEERQLAEADLEALVAILLEVEPWHQAAEPDETRLDRRRAYLRAELRGAQSTCWEWLSEIESDDGRIRRFLRWARTSGALPTVEAPRPDADADAPVPSLTDAP